MYCDYGYNTGTAYFDDIQLVRNSLETGLSASDFVVESTGESEENTETTDTTLTFNEAKDKFGNALTETTFTDGEFGTIYRAFGFTSDCNCVENAGNDLVSETDARGYTTCYTVDEDTSKNKEVIDRCGNKTAYEYDDTGRTTKVTSKDASDTELATVSYAYDSFDNMTEIVRGDGMKYVLKYNAFHNLESIGVDGKDEKLVAYTYKNGNGRLKEIAYANGNRMKASYNGSGQMVAEKWYSDETCQNLTRHYKYVYDGQGNIVRSIDILQKKEYNYQYENGKVVRAIENNIEVNDSEMIVGRARVIAIHYSYDKEGQLVKKTVIPAFNTIQRYSYEYPENSNAVTKLTVDGTTITSHSKTDSFGRKEFDELQIGTGFISRRFDYLDGKITEEHIGNDKLKSSPTTQLVKSILYADNSMLEYEYDAEERITKVTEKLGDDIITVTEYTYDALGQLLTETVNGEAVNIMTYDNYGNIRTKNGVEYTYGDSVWKDLLTGYGDKTITYDAQGNPTSYLGHTLAWEKGRQLKSFDGNTYTYNANGIRTSKTVDGIKHTYTIDGTKILCENWSNNTLIPLYDNEENVCGIRYNGIPYYFIKNLQGDIIAIADSSTNVVAKYRYDAWGACTIEQDTTSVGIANINPYRYRGYYFDEETGLYYLQSRYYDPVTARFISEDEVIFGTNMADCIIANNLFIYAKNNPVTNIDESGYYTMAAYAISSAVYYQMAAMSAAATSLMVSIKAFVTMIWNIFVVVGLLLIAIAAIVYICKTIGNVYSTVKAKTNVSSTEYKRFKGKICVYVLARKERKINTVFYVGRTKNIIARYSQHSNRKSRYYKGSFNMYVVYTCSSISQSKVVEQCVLAGCLTGKFTNIIFGTAPSNRIRGISSKNAKNAVKKLGSETTDTISLLGCTSESDLLFMMNQ